MTRQNLLIKAATEYLNAGLNVIAVDGNKKAIFAWKHLSEDLITVEHLEEQINSDKAQGIAIICGGVSGGLEVIDFDLKYDITGDIMARYNPMLPADLLARLRIVKTRSGGFHYMYRCEVIEGNKKLASRPPTHAELTDTPHLKQLVLIETRGNSGYVVAPPSDGYEVIQDVDVPLISISDRDLILDAARSFNQIHSEERTKFISTGTPFTISPFDDYNNKTDVVALLMRNGWTVDDRASNAKKTYLIRPGTTSAANSGNFHHEKKLFYVWSTSTQFVPEKAYSAAAIYTILNHNGDFSEASKQLIREGYGTRKTPDSVREALAKPLEVDFKFWDVTETKKGGTKIHINLSRLQQFIHLKGGFSGYKYSETSENIIVQVKDGLVKEVEIYDIKQFLKNEILSLPDTFDGITPEDLLEVVYREYLQYLSKGFMEFLEVSKLDFLRDTETVAYFPFKNGIIEVTKNGAIFHKYGEFKKVIWESQMIKKTIDLIPAFGMSDDAIEITTDFDNIDFEKFVRKAAGDTQDKFEYFISVIGYLLHKYKDQTATYAVILAEETENEADGGGTGKGLFNKGIKELIPTEIFDGKQFSPAKGFAFQRVSLDTKIIAIEDAKRGFKFEELYSQITEGITVEKKNQKEFFIPFEDSPKITISTNYTISDEGNHAKRRQKVLEFSNYFSPTRTPKDEFGKMLFTGWDNEERNRFYNFMFWCCQVYLEYGILQTDQSDSNKRKNINLKYTEDLLFYYESLPEKAEATIIELYSKFLDSCGMTAKDYDKRRFTKGLRYIAEKYGHKLTDGAKTIDSKVQKFMSISKAA